jgi:hypothetical protein
MARNVRESGISQVLLQDLAAVSPGRLAGSLRDTLIVAIAVLAGMTLRVPGMELAVPLLFLMQRERPVLTLRAGVEVFTAAVAACALGLLWVQVTDGSAMARFLGILFSTFIAAFCVVSTRIPLFWILYGFYEFIDLAAWDAPRSANAIVSSSLGNVAALGLVTLCALLVEYAFGTRHPAKELESEMKRRHQDLVLELQQYEKTLQGPEHPHPKLSFGFREWRTNQAFLPGVFESPDSALHALKLTLAAGICYILYSAIAWPGILTCVVTVLVTGLTSTGAMKQKQAYRFAGALIGGILGIAVVSLLYPNMDSIAALLCVISPVAFLAGWIMRSQRMGYVGYQIGLAFFLTALPGSSATTSISPARDRLMGIAVGVLVMWFVFDQLWPVRTTEVLEKSLLRIRQATRTIRSAHLETNTSQSTRFHYQLRSAVSLELAEVQELAFAARFELGRDHKRELVRSRRLIREIEASSAEFYAVALHESSTWSDSESRFKRD